MRNPRACGSLAQQSGDFVFMFLCRLIFVLSSSLESAESISSARPEAKEMPMQPIPEA